MSGGYFVVGPCWLCREVFSFDPYRVPSIPIDPQTRLPLDADGTTREIDPDARERAVRQPICEACMEDVNLARAARGDEPFPVLPGAYDLVEGLPD